jgi:hypothetical protein
MNHSAGTRTSSGKRPDAEQDGQHHYIDDKDAKKPAKNGVQFGLVRWRTIGRPDCREAQRDADKDEEDADDIGMRDDPANAADGTQDEERGKARQESTLHGVPPIVCLEAESDEVWAAKKQEAGIWARKDPELVRSDMTSGSVARISPAFCPSYAAHA